MSIEQPQPSRAAFEFTWMMCCKCGVFFALPNLYIDNRREDGEDFFCPNGHDQAYPDPNEEDSPEVRDLKQQLAQAVHNADQAQAKMNELQEQQQPHAHAAKPENTGRKNGKNTHKRQTEDLR
jgi:hypothetical protein